MANNTYISKGAYQHPQINGFLSAREYMFLNEGGKKCLILRFFNETAHLINAFSFTLTELDNKGKEIKKTRVKYDELKLYPAESFSSTRGVIVSPECFDFRVTVNEIVSSPYVFRVKGGVVVPFYDRRLRNKKIKSTAVYCRTVSKSFKPGGLFGFLSAVCVLLIIAIAVMSLYLPVEGFLGIPI